MTEEQYRRLVEAARDLPPGERMLAGAMLFDADCERRRGHLRRRHPDAAPEEIERRLREQLAELERMKEDELFPTVPVSALIYLHAAGPWTPATPVARPATEQLSLWPSRGERSCEQPNGPLITRRPANTMG